MRSGTRGQVKSGGQVQTGEVRVGLVRLGGQVQSSEVRSSGLSSDTHTYLYTSYMCVYMIYDCA